MPSNFNNLAITWYDESDSYVTNSNITTDVVGIPVFTDAGSGEVNYCTLNIKAPYGRYITSTDPVPIDQYDRIHITLDDLDGNTYSRYFEVQEIIPGSDKDAGTILTLECLGIEYHTQMMHFSRQFWFNSAFRPASIIGSTYNDNKGTTQPLLTGFNTAYDPDTAIGNDLPQFTQGIYDYGINPAYCYDIWLDLVERQAAATSGGGVFDFFEIGFDTPSVNQIDFRVFSSGSSPESKTGSPDPVTITKTLKINPAETEGGIDNATGTISYVMGDPRSGALQQGREIYNSGIFQFTYRPEWDAAISYSVNAIVKYEGQHYISLQNNNLNNTPPGPTSCVADSDSFWNQQDMSDRFGDTFQYSEWTEDKAALFLNGMCAPDQVTELSGVYTSTGAGAFDGNIVINANGFFRTWVDDRLSTTDAKALQSEYLYASNTYPRGYRFLNLDADFGSGTTDINGVTFENSIVELVRNPDPNADPTNNIFVVKYKLDSTNDNLQVFSIYEAKMWEWDSNTETFTDITSQDLGADCLHKFETISNTTSFDPKPSETDCAKYPDVTKDGTTFATNIDSAIEVVYDFDSALTDRVTDKDSYQAHGAWFNLRFPYPVSTFNSITEGVGDIYGGGTNSAATNIDEPATLDISNMGYTPTGLLGYNQPDSTRLAKLVTFSFALGLKIETRNPFDGSLSTLDGTAQIRVLMGDTEDNVWAFDFELTSTDGAMYPIDTELSAYNVIRNQKPRYAKLNNIIDLINPKEIDNQNIFEERNIRWIVIQHQDQYDEFGRFAPEGNLNDLSNTSISAALGGKITLTIDDLHFKKALVVNTGSNSLKNLEPDFLQRQDIMLFDQAQQVALADWQLQQFQHKEYDITTTGQSIFDIRFGDSFYLNNDRLVNDADDGPNTLKLVAKKIEYSISRPTSGRGGLERRLQGIERFT